MIEKAFNYSKFFDEIESDLTLHSHDIDKKVYEAPNTHNKILRRFMIEKGALIRLESKLNSLYGRKFHYYRYESDIKCENKDVAIFYINQDEEYIKVNDEYNKQKHLVDIIDKYMKKANNIGFDIKNIVEYLKFISGK